MKVGGILYGLWLWKSLQYRGTCEAEKTRWKTECKLQTTQDIAGCMGK